MISFLIQLCIAAKGSKTSGSSSSSAVKGGPPKIIDYISKVRFGLKKPGSRDDLYGYGLVVSGPPHRPSLTTPCEFLSGRFIQLIISTFSLYIYLGRKKGSTSAIFFFNNKD